MWGARFPGGRFCFFVVGTLLAVCRAGWLPRLSWQPAEIRELLHFFGGQVTIKKVINYGGIAPANFIIGKLLGACSQRLWVCSRIAGFTVRGAICWPACASARPQLKGLV